MTGPRASIRLAFVTSFMLMSAAAAQVVGAGPLTPAMLASGADVVMIGRVSALTVARDLSVNSLSTLVEIEPIWTRGVSTDSNIVVKQLGGVDGDVALMVPDQAEFTIGEQVLVMLERRPRDGSLYTAALWQGKWRLEHDATTGQLVAVQAHPVSGIRHVSLLDELLAEAGLDWLASQRGMWHAQGLPLQAISQPYVLEPLLVRWNESVVPVRLESGTQPGLPGGGDVEIMRAVDQWNGHGSALRLAVGARGSTRCIEDLANIGDIRITFGDPCGEISADGSTLAVTGVIADRRGGQTVGGQAFNRIIAATITTSRSLQAVQFLSSSGCFQSTIVHELGHAFGLGHSTDRSALMYEAISHTCKQGPHALAADDIAGLLALYPGSSAVVAAPTGVTATVSAGALTVTWNTPASGARPTSHRLDFAMAPGGATVTSVATGPGESAVVGMPPGTSGSFAVTVRAIAGTTTGPSSTTALFTVGAPLCGPPAAVTGLSGGVAAGSVTLTWSPVASAVSYMVEAGSRAGATDLFVGNVGAATSVRAPVSPGFQAFARVYAVNACGQRGSASIDWLIR